MKKSSKIILIAGILLSVVGAVGAAPTLYFETTHHGTANAEALLPAPTAAVSPAVTNKPVVSGYPISISFPSVNINNVSVVDGVYDAKKKDWTLSLHNAHYAVMTARPNDTGGQTYIYGHYRPEVFAYLHHIKPGAQAFITTDNGYRFVYNFQGSIDVDPTNTNFLNYQGPPVLTVQTCSGSWMQNRELFRFTFDHVEKM
jgi:hypothetical protein